MTKIEKLEAQIIKALDELYWAKQALNPITTLNWYSAIIVGDHVVMTFHKEEMDAIKTQPVDLTNFMFGAVIPALKGGEE